MADSIEDLRKEIDSLDEKIVELLNQRALLAAKIGEIKKGQSQGAYDPKREKEIYQHILSANQGPVSKEALLNIYKEIMSGMLMLEKEVKVAFLGPPGTFSHSAAKGKFGSSVEFVPARAIEDVFALVAREKTDYGVVPIETSSGGGVVDTMDVFMDYDVKVAAEVLLPVHHNLLSRSPRERVKKIYSKPEALAQCRQYLAANFPLAELISTASTTEAAQIASQEAGAAAIASAEAASLYEIPILEAEIEDSPQNLTRFFVLGRHPSQPTGSDKTSIMFSVKDEVGALYEMLLPFKEHNINLTRIESRPSRRRPWDYNFFVDLEGHRKDQEVKTALTELQTKCQYLQILGSYPKAHPLEER
jgi:chorismate mutase/prephenate dehydratase